MNKDYFIHKYGDNNSVKQIFFRKAYQNYFTVKQNGKQKYKKNKSVDQRKLSNCNIKTDQSKSSFIDTQENQFQNTLSNINQQKCQMQEFHYNQLKSKWLNNDKLSTIYIQNLQQKKKQLEVEELLRYQDNQKKLQAIELREHIETDRKKQFYKEAELFRNQQSARKHQEQEKIKFKEQQYKLIAQQLAEKEQLDKLEEQIIHKQKCRMQFQMLESQRKTNSFILS